MARLFPRAVRAALGARRARGGAALLPFARGGEKFARLIDDFRPDVIHAHGLYHHLTNAILTPARQRGVPIVYTLHDYKLICPAYHFYTPKAASAKIAAAASNGAA